MAQDASKRNGQPFLFSLSVALVSSCAHTTAFYPIHRLKSLLQTQDAIPDVQSGRIARFTVLGGFGRIVREQGLLGLW